MMTNLSRLNISSNVFNWLLVFQADHPQNSCVTNSLCNYSAVMSGLPRVLTLRLCSLFSPLTTSWNIITLLAYSPMSVLYRPRQSVRSFFPRELRNNINSPCSNWLLSLNAHKCCLISFSCPFHPTSNS